MLWNEDIFGYEILASGPAHPQGMPSVQNLHVVRREEYRYHGWRSGLRDPGLAILHHDGRPGKPSSELTATAKRPTRIEAISAIHWDDLRRGTEGSSEEYVGCGSENLSGGVVCEQCAD